MQAAGADPIAVKWGANVLTVDGPWRSVNLSGPGTVLATYADGTPAAVEIVKGRGRVRVVGFELGPAYWHGVKTFRREFQFGFQDVARTTLLNIPNSLGVKRPSGAATRLSS